MQSKLRQVDSVRRRYISTLFSNSALFMMSFMTAGIVPRALGPRQLGDFSFLSRTFSALRNMLEMGTSGAFYNYNSKHEETGPLVKVYSVWLLGQIFITLSLIAIAVLIGVKELIWPSQELKYIIWVAIFDWILFMSSIARQLADSKGYTVKAQWINLFIGLANTLALVLFAVFGMLNLARYIAIQTFASALISLTIAVSVMVPHKDIYWDGVVSGRVKGFLKYFYRFCAPLVGIALAGFVFEYIDRIFLQKFGGSVQQGYFHIASSWSAFAALFTGSFISVYKREVTHSFGAKDIYRASKIFTRYVKMLYFLTLTLAVFLAFNAGELLALIAGPQFRHATPVLIIMAFYPVHQVYGMLGGATFYSTEETALYRNISVIAMLLGIAMSYFFLAPSNLIVPGLGLGSVGLALKTVVWNLLVVQVYLIYNCKLFKISPKSFWWHQVYALLVPIFIMFFVKTGIDFFVKGEELILVILKLGTETFAYFGVVAIITYIFPQIAGITRDEINFFMKKIKSVYFSFDRMRVAI